MKPSGRRPGPYFTKGHSIMSGAPRLTVPERLAVIGAGSWGTAIAYHLAQKGLEIDLWVFEPEVAGQILDHRENKTFLPGVILPDNVFPGFERPPVHALFDDGRFQGSEIFEHLKAHDVLSERACLRCALPEHFRKPAVTHKLV